MCVVDYRRLYSAEVDQHISQNIRDNRKKSYSKNVPEIPTKYRKEQYKNRFKVQTRILLSDEMLKLGCSSAILHRGTERSPRKSRCITEVMLFVNIYGKITVIFYLLSCV